MPKLDLHIHSSISPDCRTPLELQINAARKMGLETIAITEHWDFDRWNPDWGFSVHERSMESLKPDSFGLEVIFGAELAFHRHYEEHARHYVSTTPLDFVLGSVHELGTLNISELEEARQLFDMHGRKTFDIYFDSVMRVAQTDLYDSLAHIDIVKRFALEAGFQFKPKDYKSIICDILEAVVKSGKALEINTSGLRQSPQEAFPGFQTVEWFLERNGRHITIGSDAHRPEHVGYELDFVCERLREMGVRELAVFRKRILANIPLD